MKPVLIRQHEEMTPPGLLDQLRIVEILFGADAAMELYAEQRRRNTAG